MKIDVRRIGKSTISNIEVVGWVVALISVIVALIAALTPMETLMIISLIGALMGGITIITVSRLRSVEELPDEGVDSEPLTTYFLKTREKAIKFLFFTYGALVCCTVLIIFFQGFKIYGFELSDGFLGWLGAAALGEVVGIAAIVYIVFFRRR